MMSSFNYVVRLCLRMNLLRGFTVLSFICYAAGNYGTIPPKIVKGPDVKDANVKEIATFECKVAGPPFPAITWLFNGEKILRQNSTIETSEGASVLKIKVKSDSEGHYCCVASNRHRNNDKLCGALHVKKAPKVSIYPDYISVNEGSSSSVQCIATGRPSPTVYWYFNDIRIKCDQQRKGVSPRIHSLCSRVSLKDSSLRWENISLIDAGKYQCYAWNGLGNVMSTAAKVVVVKHIKEERYEKMTTTTTAYAPDATSVSNKNLLWLFGIAGVVLAGILAAYFVISKKFCHKRAADESGRKEEMPRISSLAKLMSEGSNLELSGEQSLHHLLCYGIKLQLVKEIGEGVFGKVFEAQVAGLQSIVGSTSVAIKTLHVVNDSTMKDMYREAMLLHSFTHPNIVQLLGICHDKSQFTATGTEQPNLPFLIFEYVDCGDLCTYLRNQSETVLCSDDTESFLSMNSRLRGDIDKTAICCQIACGMKYLSNHNFVHRDLATRNCLISSRGNAKIADFGLSRKMFSADYYKAGDMESAPIRWMAPESLMYGRYSSQTDVWSFGVVVWEIYTYAMQPYFGLKNEHVIETVLKGSILPKPMSAPMWMYNLMQLCWSYSAGDRPDFDTIYSVLTGCKLDGNDFN